MNQQSVISIFCIIMEWGKNTPNHGYKIQHFQCEPEVYIQETWITWRRIVYWWAPLYLVIKRCAFFFTNVQKKPQTTWALHCLIGRKYQSNFPKGRTADVICFLNIQIYEIDNTILHCVLNIGTIFLITSSVFE